MSKAIRAYNNGTYIEIRLPWGEYISADALCPDGKIRKTKRISATADTFFSVPASIRFRGKTVAGYITIEDETVRFIPYKNRKNGNIFNESVQLSLPLP